MSQSDYSKGKMCLLREKYGGIETPAFFEDVKKLESGEPLDYLIGFSEFLGCTINLSFRPLIPRAETEFWVEKAMQEMQNTPLHILDIFSGSGCIGVALLKHLPNAQVDFGEKDSNLVLQIEKNIVLNKIAQERARLFVSDVFTNIQPKKYDYIFANPPYISRERIENVQKSVLDHEPEDALFAPDNGLFFVKKLIAEAPQYLAPNGKLFIEFDSWQKEEIEKLLGCQGEASPHVARLRLDNDSFQKDQYDKYRTVVISCTI